MSGIGGELGQEVAVVGAVPQAHAGGQPDRPRARVPLPVRDAHLDLAPRGVEGNGRRGARDGLSGRGVGEVGGQT